MHLFYNWREGCTDKSLSLNLPLYYLPSCFSRCFFQWWSLASCWPRSVWLEYTRHVSFSICISCVRLYINIWLLFILIQYTGRGVFSILVATSINLTNVGLSVIQIVTDYTGTISMQAKTQYFGLKPETGANKYPYNRSAVSGLVTSSMQLPLLSNFQIIQPPVSNIGTISSSSPFGDCPFTTFSFTSSAICHDRTCSLLQWKNPGSLTTDAICYPLTTCINGQVSNTGYEDIIAGVRGYQSWG